MGNGMAGIPEDWNAYIGDEIITISLAQGGVLGRVIPATCTDLTNRVVALTPAVLYSCLFRIGRRYTVKLGDQTEVPENCFKLMRSDIAGTVAADMKRLHPRTFSFKEVQKLCLGRNLKVRKRRFL